MSGSFAERDLQLEASYASSPPCISTSHDVQLFFGKKKKFQKGGIPRTHAHTPKRTRGVSCENVRLSVVFYVEYSKKLTFFLASSRSVSRHVV